MWIAHVQTVIVVQRAHKYNNLKKAWTAFSAYASSLTGMNGGQSLSMLSSFTNIFTLFLSFQ